MVTRTNGKQEETSVRNNSNYIVPQVETTIYRSTTSVLRKTLTEKYEIPGTTVISGVYVFNALVYFTGPMAKTLYKSVLLDCAPTSVGRGPVPAMTLGQIIQGKSPLILLRWHV